MADFLFELGVEEVPVSEAPSIRDQLEAAFREELEVEHISGETVEVAATNRRFMVYITGLPEKAEDRHETLTGPSRRIAYDDSGNPAIPLSKFLEANGADLEDVQEVETAKGVYMAISRQLPGEQTIEILKEIIPRILAGLTFRKAMVWNRSRIPFIRPIRNILALLDNELIETRFAGISTSREIDAHPLLAEDRLEINSYREYIEKLHKNFVIPGEKEREKIILQDALSLAGDMDADFEFDPEMLHYYVFNNEYPVVFSGTFDRRYLSLPQEIIAEFMRNEKKLHPIYDSGDRLMNHFIGVSNVPDEHRNVAEGNEKVIQATFEDAVFFWERDRETDFKSLSKSLETVIFHKGLGSFHEKCARLEVLVEHACKLTDNAPLLTDLKEAAGMCKNDLLTLMVGEFPSLQGVMGGLYLRETGVPEPLWKSVYRHYEPRGFTPKPIQHLGGGLLSLCDKMDNICAFLSKGIRTSSSSDPYGIRRDANAIIKIVLDLKLDFDLGKLIDRSSVLLVSNDKQRRELIEKVASLFTIRMENLMRDNLSIRHDIASAVLSGHSMWLFRLFLKARDISTLVGTPSIQPLIILHKRLKNIAKSVETSSGGVAHDLLREKEEKVLFEILTATRDTIDQHLQAQEYLSVVSEILEMKPIIDDFFDNVLVMAKEPELKNNRISLVREIDETLMQVADFTRIVEVD